GRLDRLADARTLAEYAGAVRELVGALGIASAAAECDDERIVAADLRALRAFDELLEEVAAAAVPVGTDLEKMAGLVARAAEVAVVPPARGESLVAVLDVLDARALRFEKVYLLGLNEKAFPQLRQERCFIDESDRAAWARRSVVLDRRSDLVAREMLLFYLAATRAESHLTVSYVASSSRPPMNWPRRLRCSTRPCWRPLTTPRGPRRHSAPPPLPWWAGRRSTARNCFAGPARPPPLPWWAGRRSTARNCFAGPARASSPPTGGTPPNRRMPSMAGWTTRGCWRGWPAPFPETGSSPPAISTAMPGVPGCSSPGTC
ncbi:MAG: hypothetical protein B1H04_06850, partial [Planctomycetales bacterium 4484_123]